MENERDLNKENLIESEMNQKGQGHGIFGLPIANTRWIYRILIIVGLILLITQPTKALTLDWTTLLSREVGFLLFGIGVVLFVTYR